MCKTNKTILATLCGALLSCTGVAGAQNTSAASTAMPAMPATSMAAPAAATATAAPAAKPAATAKVARAQFTSAVNNREPADELTSLDSSHDKVFFFTALDGADGQTITHRWEFGGKTVAEVKFEPKANRWRVWSSKTLMPDQIGTWTVEVLDDAGNVLSSKSFDYSKAPMAAPAPAAGTSTPPPAASTMTPAPSATTHAGHR